MKEKYDLYDELFDKRYVDDSYDGIELGERLMYLQLALDNVCELLEELVNCTKEEKKEEVRKKEEQEKSAFKLGKIGADIGEEKGQLDIIAKIFGNK